LLDGHVYQVNSKGAVIPVPDDTLTPFACVTFFRSLSHDMIDRELDYPGFLAMIGKLL
jgi:acetolactate decarboxylase